MEISTKSLIILPILKEQIIIPKLSLKVLVVVEVIFHIMEVTLLPRELMEQELNLSLILIQSGPETRVIRREINMGTIGMFGINTIRIIIIKDKPKQWEEETLKFKDRITPMAHW